MGKEVSELQNEECYGWAIIIPLNIEHNDFCQIETKRNEKFNNLNIWKYYPVAKRLVKMCFLAHKILPLKKIRK